MNIDEIIARENARIATLKPLVQPFHADNVPALPEQPAGMLHGVGFILDEDNDYRVLVAIDQLPAELRGKIVALAEHEGGVTIYSREPTNIGGMTVCMDEWSVDRELIVAGRKWAEAEWTDSEGIHIEPTDMPGLSDQVEEEFRAEEAALQHLIYDGMATTDRNGKTHGSVRPT